MTTKQGWLTIQQESRCVVRRGNVVTVDTASGYAIPQPADTLAGFKLDASAKCLAEAHVERMESDSAQEMFRDTFFEV